MRNTAALLALVLAASGAAIPSMARAADILIENEDINWKLGDKAANPLVFKAAKDDVIVFKVNTSGEPHGVVTLDKPGNATPAPTPAVDLVLACGEAEASKPNHVLREIECDVAGSKFNKIFTAGIPAKFKVTEKFQKDVHFWCIIHRRNMWGTIQPTPSTSMPMKPEAR